MGCNKGCKGDAGEACAINIGKLVGRGAVSDPADQRPANPAAGGVPGSTAQIPGGSCACSTNANGGGGFATSNCMFGPQDETTCTRQKRQLAKQSTVEVATAEIDTTAPHFITMDKLGFSPYEDEDGNTGDLSTPFRFLVDVPTHRLTACVRVCEFRVTILGTTGNVKYSGPAGMVQGYSSYVAVEDNVTKNVVQSTGQKFGTNLLTTDGRCACDCIDLWHTWDTPPEATEGPVRGQIEFTIPGYGSSIVVAEDDTITVEYQASRLYYASNTCDFPERCGETLWAEIYAGEP